MKVYLSSTFQDLRDHRAAVDRTLRKMGHDVIGMEQYAAEGSRPVERCKRDVELSDAYVLILGWRYGYTPTHDNPEERSITEIEFRHAVDRGKAVLAFLLDPETPWPPSLMDSASADTTAAERIGRLRSEVASEYLAGIFSSPDDLASQVGAAVASFGLTKPLSEMVLNRTAVTAEEMGRFGTGGSLYDTSLEAVKQMIARTGKDRAIVVNLGDGDVWWSTRLFLLASLLRSLTMVRQVAFTGRGGGFAGMASPDALVEGLSARFRELDAFVQRLRETVATEDRQQEIERQVNLWTEAFTPQPKPPARQRSAGAAGTTKTSPKPHKSEQEAQVGVREELLQGWLGERLITRCIDVRGGLSMSQVQQVVDCLVPDVPVQEFRFEGGATTNQNGVDLSEDQGAEPLESVHIKIIDRDAFALELAREWVRSGLPRNPGR